MDLQVLLATCVCVYIDILIDQIIMIVIKARLIIWLVTFKSFIFL